MSPELVMVMPVYNEEGCIGEVVRAWHKALTQTNAGFKIIVLNDGSRDGTAKALDQFKDWPEIIVIHKKNSGHASTILLGYHQARSAEARWVFQCDSDNEMKPDSFMELWQHREGYDGLFGIRSGREQNWLRKAISICSRWTVFAFCGKGVCDVNVPYRLIRSEILGPIIKQIPEDTFAPNVIISAVLNKMGARIWECPVAYQPRSTGKVSLASWKAFRMAIKAFYQTGQCLSRINCKGIRHGV